MTHGTPLRGIHGRFYNSATSGRLIPPRPGSAALQIITYPHPTLRHKSKPIRRVDPELREIVRSMFGLMYENKGIGLAANQVDLPLRLFVVNLKSDPQEGEEMVFLNPVISFPKGSEEAEEGCLSLPGLYGNVIRPKQVRINAYTLEGKEVDMVVSDLLSRCVQHELDHLDGVLFPDRMSPASRTDLADELGEFEAEFSSRRATGSIPSDEQIAARLVDWERRYC